jgi:hypothetical protein
MKSYYEKLLTYIVTKVKANPSPSSIGTISSAWGSRAITIRLLYFSSSFPFSWGGGFFYEDFFFGQCWEGRVETKFFRVDGVQMKL